MKITERTTKTTVIDHDGLVVTIETTTAGGTSIAVRANSGAPARRGAKLELLFMTWPIEPAGSRTLLGGAYFYWWTEAASAPDLHSILLLVDKDREDRGDPTGLSGSVNRRTGAWIAGGAA